MGTPGQPLTDKFGRPIVTPDWKPAGPAHSIDFAVENASSPSTLYIERDDQLLIVAATSQTNEVVTVNLRILTADGRIQDNQFTIRPPNTRATLQQGQTLVEGYLLSMSAIAAVATTRGQTFVRCMIVRSGSTAAGAAQMLFADYVTTLVTSGYPNGRIVSPTEGPGNTYAFTIGNPGAGADFTITVPTNARWRVRCLQALFTTDATAGNRQIQVRIVVNSLTVWIGTALVNTAPSTAVFVLAAALVPYTSIIATNLYVPLPPDLLFGSISAFSGLIQSVTQNKGAGDQWSGISLLVEEWLDNV